MIFALMAFLLFSSAAYAESEGGVKEHGVIHNIAEDRKVEKIGGIYEPEALDKYLKRKFDDMSAQLTDMNQKLSSLSSEVKAVSDQVKALAPAQAKT